MKSRWVISVPVAPIYAKPIFSAEMVSQSLLWDSVEVLKTEHDWNLIKLWDGYEGWIHSFYIYFSSILYDKSIMITDRNKSVLLEKNNSINLQIILSFGTKVPFVYKNDNMEIIFPDGRQALIDKKLFKIDKSRSSLIILAEKLLGVPYLWGGISSFGFDCSGFVQSVLKSLDIGIARDSKDQYKDKRLFQISINDVEPGDLFFFFENEKINHVGFAYGKNKIIHCSGEVKIDSYNKDNADYNERLFSNRYIAMSISNLFNSNVSRSQS